MDNTFHKGERQIQEKYGEAYIADQVIGVVNNTIIGGAISFIEKQAMAIVSSIDTQNNVWVSFLVGDFGFTEVPNETSIAFNKEKILSPDTDIFFQNIENNPEMGSLFIELGSRRRFRINGKATTSEKYIKVDIQEAYPNCPKYIQKRIISFPDKSPTENSTILQGLEINNKHKDLITNSDTLFVGSMSKSERLDASHRGGNSGFVEVLYDGTLKIPDYTGNSMYNTLGNFIENPNAGLLFIDFENGSILQLTGKASLLFDQDSVLDKEKTGNTGRFWLFKTEKWIQTDNHHKLKWGFEGNSRFNPSF